MLALLACAPSDAGTILASTLEGSQKSDALAGCRFALDGRLYDIGALAGMTIAVPADIDVGNFAGKAGPEGGSPDTESSLVSALSSGGKLALQKVVQGGDRAAVEGVHRVAEYLGCGLGGALPRAFADAIRAQLDSGAFFHHPTSHRKSDDAVTRNAITNDYARYAAYAGQMCE